VFLIQLILFMESIRFELKKLRVKLIIWLFVQNETNIMELYASRRFKLSNSYNVKHRYNNIFIPISAWPLKQISHSNLSRLKHSRSWRKSTWLHNEMDAREGHSQHIYGICGLIGHIKKNFWIQIMYVIR
jgi:hypothetical protein